jgi:hypothetical protein
MNWLYFQHLPLVIGILIVTIVLLKRMTENFAPIEFSEQTLELKTGRSKHNVNTVLSNGEIQYFFDGKHNYQLFFNLPLNDSPFQTSDLEMSFNKTKPVIQYSVLADNIQVGNLERHGSGIHQFMMKSNEQVKKFVIKLGDIVVDSVEF